MDQSKITTRYAKAFFSLSKENKLLDVHQKDIELIDQLTTDRTFRLLLESPVVKTSVKQKILHTLFAGKIDTHTLNFLQLIAKNKRESHLPSICRNILSLFRQEKRIKSAIITSAVSLAPNTINEIRSRLEQEFNAHIELREQVNTNLIGGFILRIDDQQIDASLASQLKKAKERLLQSEVK